MSIETNVKTKKINKTLKKIIKSNGRNEKKIKHSINFFDTNSRNIGHLNSRKFLLQYFKRYNESPVRDLIVLRYLNNDQYDIVNVDNSVYLLI